MCHMIVDLCFFLKIAFEGFSKAKDIGVAVDDVRITTESCELFPFHATPGKKFTCATHPEYEIFTWSACAIFYFIFYYEYIKIIKALFRIMSTCATESEIINFESDDLA